MIQEIKVTTREGHVTKINIYGGVFYLVCIKSVKYNTRGAQNR